MTAGEGARAGGCTIAHVKTLGPCGPSCGGGSDEVEAMEPLTPEQFDRVLDLIESPPRPPQSARDAMARWRRR